MLVHLRRSIACAALATPYSRRAKGQADRRPAPTVLRVVSFNAAFRGTARRVTHHAAANDRVIVASRAFHSFRSAVEGGDRITVLNGADPIDAMRLRTDQLGHSYFGDSATVVSTSCVSSTPGARFRRRTTPAVWAARRSHD